MIINKTEFNLFELIKCSLFGKTAEFSEDVDWNAVLAEAKAQTVVSLVKTALPTEVADAWKLPAYQSEMYFLRALFEQTKCVSLLKDANIPAVIIKGAAAAIYYPHPHSRSMGDIDVLVADGYFDAAFSLLKEKGYIYQKDYGDNRDYTFTKDGVVFELHRKYSDDDHHIEYIIKDGIIHSDDHNLYGETFSSLPKAENGLVILDHIRHHLIGGLGLRQIIDFMMFVNSEPDEKKFENEYLPLFEKAGLSTLAKVIAKTCKKYLGLPVSVSWSDTADDQTCDDLIKNVLLSGNFGRKNPYKYRPMQSFTMSVKRDGFFRTLQKAGVENCAAFKKHKILRPFAWLYQLFRYFKRGISALFKREKLKEDISSGKEKADFLKRLGI